VANRIYAMRYILLFTLIGMTACSSSKQLVQDNPDEENWEQLFNGKNLYGWDIKFAGEDMNVNYKNTFVVANNSIRINYNEYENFNNKYAHLYYFKPYSYYKLVYQYRFHGDQIKGGASWNVRNSGIMVHSQSARSNDFEQHFPVSIEMQLLGGLSDGKQRTTGNMCSPGTSVVYKGKVDDTHCISSNSKTYDGDDWVSAEIVVLGDSIIHQIIEGDTVLTYTQPQIDGAFISDAQVDGGWKSFGVYSDMWKGREGGLLSEGYIALQAESHPIDFRDIQLLNLKGCKDENALNYKNYYIQHDANSCKYNHIEN